MSKTQTNAQGKKPIVFDSSTVSLGLALGGILAVGLFTHGFACGPFAVIGLVFGLVGLYQRKKRRRKLLRDVPAIGAVVINSFLVFVAIFSLYGQGDTRDIARRILCGTSLRGLGKAMQIYAGDYDDQYPTAEKWCDLLIAYSEVSPKQFVCPLSDVIEGESSYAMNKNVVGKKVSEIPEDVVLLFETNFGKNPAGRQELLGNRDWYKELSSRGDRWDLKWIKKYRSSEKVYKQRWNQFGGPEILTTENHKGKGCNILFNDSHVKFVKPERLGELKWEVEESEK